MHKQLAISILALGFGLASLGASAAPAKPCTQGHAIDGTCVKPELARAMRKHVIARTQAKFSYTAPLHLPSEDGDNELPSPLYEINALYTFPARTDSCERTRCGP